jgi:hypothetical protein
MLIKKATNRAQDSTRQHSSLCPSLCAPVDVVPLLPSFFQFLYFSLIQEHTRSNTENWSSNK